MLGKNNKSDMEIQRYHRLKIVLTENERTDTWFYVGSSHLGTIIQHCQVKMTWI